MDKISDVNECSLDVVEQTASRTAKIQRIPAFLGRFQDFSKYCTPMIISFGPIHHRTEGLKLGQQFKIQWTSQYIEEYRKKNHISASEAELSLHKAIEDNIGELKKLFSEDVIEAYDDQELAKMLFEDGCSLLYYMDKVDIHRPEALKLKIDQLVFTMEDILLLENQLPMRLLELLTLKQGANLDDLIGKIMLLNVGEAMNAFKHKHKSTHLLDCLRSILAETQNGKNVRNNNDGVEPLERNQMTNFFRDIMSFWQRYKNIRDLKTAGIRVKPNAEGVQKWDKMKWGDVSFTSGWFGAELRLPVTLFNHYSPIVYRNLIAYAMCPDFDNNFGCCAYLSFMDSLIDDAEDAKELRLAGVVQNLLGSDEDVAKLFNELGKCLPTHQFIYVRSDAVAYSETYVKVKHQIEEHYRETWNKWLADARCTNFNTPWSLIGFLAALLALVLTFVQTWYALHPK